MEQLTPLDPPTSSGWYPDPVRKGTERFHNGLSFTDLCRPAPFETVAEMEATDRLARFSLHGFPPK